MECSELSGADAGAVARAYTIARDAAELRGLWADIEALDGRVLAADQYQAHWRTSRFLRHATLWLLEHRSEYANIGRAVTRLQPALRELVQLVPGALVGLDRERYLEQRQHLLAQGFPERLAERLAVLEPMQVAFELCELIRQTGQPARRVAHTHFGLAGPLGFDWLQVAIERLPGADDWQRAAKAGLLAGARAAHLRLSTASLQPRSRARALSHAAVSLQRWRAMINSLRALPSVELPALTVALQALKTLADAHPRVLAPLP
jgi:glutamate dehydrogenase